MIESLFPPLFSLGFVLGLKHALEADHVVAISTLVSQTKSLRKSSLLGVLWGIGHTLTLFMTGVAVLVFRLSISTGMAQLLEFLVGVLLVILGVDLLRKVTQGKVHFHAHDDGSVHIHLHSHGQSLLHNHVHRSLFIGMIHGLAGSGALVLLVLTTVESVSQGLLFIVIFGVGSIVGMWITSTLIALPFKFIAGFDRLNNVLRILSGILSVAIGFMVMVEVHLSNPP